MGAFAGLARGGDELVAIRAHRVSLPATKLPASIAGTKIQASRSPAAAPTSTGPGAETRKSPADAEDRGAREQARVDRIARRHRNSPPSAGAGCLQHESKRDAGDRDCAAHDERERRVPMRRRRREIQARPSDPSCRRSRGRRRTAHRTRMPPRARLHGAGPEQWRITKTVAMPAAMNVTTAASERFEKPAEPADAMPAGAAIAQARAESDQESGGEEQERRGTGLESRRRRRDELEQRRAPAIIIPARNAMRQARSPRAALDDAVDDAADAGDAADRPQQQRRPRSRSGRRRGGQLPK